MHRRFQKVYGGFTRPADTTNYGALDAMGQGAGDCIISFPISPAGADLSGRVSGKVVSAHLTKSDHERYIPASLVGWRSECGS